MNTRMVVTAIGKSGEEAEEMLNKKVEAFGPNWGLLSVSGSGFQSGQKVKILLTGLVVLAEKSRCNDMPITVLKFDPKYRAKIIRLLGRKVDSVGMLMIASNYGRYLAKNRTEAKSSKFISRNEFNAIRRALATQGLELQADYAPRA